MVYYALALAKLPGFLLVNNIINGVVEIILVIILAFLVNEKWFYRKYSMALFYGICGILAISN
jgi:hypothetical protein